MIHFKSAVLFKGKFVKIQPHTKDFLDISDPKAVLETSLRCAGACAAPGARRALTCAAHACLTVAPSRAGPRLPSSGACSAKPPVLARRHYSCLTEGDTVVIQYNGKNFYIDIKECRPQRAVSIIETDCEVDFEAPKDYVEPKPSPKVPRYGARYVQYVQCYPEHTAVARSGACDEQGATLCRPRRQHRRARRGRPGPARWSAGAGAVAWV